MLKKVKKVNTLKCHAIDHSISEIQKNKGGYDNSLGIKKKNTISNYEMERKIKSEIPFIN